MTRKISRLAKSLWGHEQGATAIEYGLIAAFIALIIIGGVTLVGTDLSNVFNQVGNSV
ncbi:MAG: Flp family type IVb pilin [Rhodospirillales bacterium]|nr:Flp family type IVb pilin [Rhodospirillales bacterium]